VRGPLAVRSFWHASATAAYLKCGILAHGFARVRCQTCHDEIVVAFSCKRRGICSSCTARRMADTAAHLVDRMLPRAPYRQWVFTVPKPLRLVRAREPAWTSWGGGLVVRAIGAWQKRAARKRGRRTLRARTNSEYSMIRFRSRPRGAQVDAATTLTQGASMCRLVSPTARWRSSCMS